MTAGNRLCKSDPEGLIDYCTAEARWTVIFDLAGRFDCMAGKHLLLGLVILSDSAAQIRSSVCWGEVVEEAVDPLRLECAYPRQPDCVPVCFGRNPMYAGAVLVEGVQGIAAREVCYFGLGSID